MWAPHSQVRERHASSYEARVLLTAAAVVFRVATQWSPSACARAVLLADGMLSANTTLLTVAPIKDHVHECLRHGLGCLVPCR